jgi:hypothetical protein
MTNLHFKFHDRGDGSKRAPNDYLIEVSRQKHERDEPATPQSYAAALRRARSIRERYAEHVAIEK